MNGVPSREQTTSCLSQVVRFRVHSFSKIFISTTCFQGYTKCEPGSRENLLITGILGRVTRRHFHISRPVLWINTVGPATIGMWLSGDLWSWDFLPVLLWLTLPFNLLIYGINDVFDQETDAKNPRKGTLEGARIEPGEVRIIWLGVLLANLPFLIYFVLSIPLLAVFWMILYALLFAGYSVPPARFKARPYLDSLSNAAYAFPLVFTPLALSASPVWPAATGLMAWSVAKHTFDAVQDVDEDRRVGIETTAVRLGPEGVVLWSGAFWALATVCFALVNVPVALVNAAIAGSLVYLLHRDPTPQKGHRLYKYSIIFPYVAGTVAGVQLVGALSLGLYP
jgi:4-hydroxybenzoate polyprenyltransferase